MKILYHVTVLSCFISMAAFAQQKGNVEVGAQFGLSRSGIDLISADGPTGSRTISGHEAGIYADVYWSNSWSLRIKALYDQKGFEERDYLATTIVYAVPPGVSGYSGPVYPDNIFRYISIPLTVNYHFGYLHRFNFDFGPYVGILLSAKQNGTFYSNLNIKNQYNNADAGLAIGFGYKIPVYKRLKLFIGLEAQNGITNAIKETDDEDGGYRNVRGSLNIGICF